MELLDVVVVGAGPAGSTCAGILKRSGLSVALVDRAVFPRSKLCAGWLTESVFDRLHISPGEYSRQNVLQPISRFVVWDRKNAAHPVPFGKTVSYGVIRREFDAYLLKKSGVPLRDTFKVDSIRNLGEYVEINHTLRAKVVVGAGGHFCPVSVSLGNSTADTYTLAAMESETELDEETVARYIPYPGSPEVFYLDDLKGYAWFFSKGPYLSIGIGSLKRRDVRRELAKFMDVLKRSGRLPEELSTKLEPFSGHAYKIYPGGRRTLTGERTLIIGDAAGLSSATSGEGIRPAVVSASLAAETIIEADGTYTAEKLASYRKKIVSAFGSPDAPQKIKEVSPFEKLLFDKLLLGTGAGRRYIIKHLFL